MKWVTNFSIKRSGYQVLAPALDDGFYWASQVMFGEDSVIVKDILVEWDGVDCISSYIKEEELSSFSQAIMDCILHKPEIAERVNRETYEINDQFFAFAKECRKNNYAEMSDVELGKLFDEFVDLQEKAHRHALTTTWFLDSHDQRFSKYLIEKTKEMVAEGDPAHVFSILTTKPDTSLVMQEEIESLQVLARIMKNEQARDALLKAADLTHIPILIPEDIKNIMKDHYRKWLWMQFTYLGPAYEIEYFLTVWRGLLKEEINPLEEIEKLQGKPEEVRAEREKFFEKLQIDHALQRTYDIAADITFLKGYRKDVSFHGFYVSSFMLKEMAKRLSFSMNQIYLITPKELVAHFVDGENIDVNEINKRSGYTVWRRPVDGSLEIYTGEEAKEFLAKYDLQKDEIDLSVKEFHGTTACSGVAKGVVRIVNVPEEIHKMNQGDIMVAHSTFPSLVPAMKKAAAIVTEDGGITCHAAIVSRELGTPCVTGIKNACQVLQDGMEVEVDASEGVVKIL